MPYIDVNPNPVRSLKAIAQTIYGNAQAPSPQDFGYVRDLKLGRFYRSGSKVSWEDEIKSNKLTDIEVERLERWLKTEETERARRQQDYQKKMDPIAQLTLEERVKVDSRLKGYIVLPCQHLRRRINAFSVSNPSLVICIHKDCGKTYRFQNEKMVEVK